MTDPFAPALAQLSFGTWSLFGPAHFQDYLAQNHITHKDTAQSISIDFLDKLAPSLRKAGVMVLRTGQGQFALVATPNRLHDFFLHDQPTTPEPYTEPVDPEILKPYRVMPKLTETSLVNLAFASGLMGHALNLDRPYPTAAPATGSTTYDFSFRPHTEMPDVVSHTKGQVEIDAVFIGRRAGKPHLFIVEAKSDTRPRTLAKHKLVYPLLALARSAEIKTLPRIPVYLKVMPHQESVDYAVTECRFPDPEAGVPALDQLEPVAHRCLRLSGLRSAV